MIGAYVRRGLAAGLVAGVLAGAFALGVGEPPVEAAIAIEEAAAAPDDHAHGPAAAEITRPQQKAGLVAGTVLVGLAVGALFGVAMAWSAGRLRGDGWTRALKLGAVVLAAAVLLPALTAPANPPAVGDPETVGLRGIVWLGTVTFGLLLAAAAWTSARRLAERGLDTPRRQALVGAGVLVTAGAFVALLPPPGDAGAFPADLLWAFRLASVATQALLYGGIAAAFGLLTARTERAASSLVSAAR